MAYDVLAESMKTVCDVRKRPGLRLVVPELDEGRADYKLWNMSVQKRS